MSQCSTGIASFISFFFLFGKQPRSPVGPDLDQGYAQQQEEHIRPSRVAPNSHSRSPAGPSLDQGHTQQEGHLPSRVVPVGSQSEKLSLFCIIGAGQLGAPGSRTPAALGGGDVVGL